MSHRTTRARDTYPAAFARLEPGQQDRAPSPADLDSTATPEHRYRCGPCGGRFIAADIRDRHEATCPATDPWMLGRTRA